LVFFGILYQEKSGNPAVRGRFLQPQCPRASFLKHFFKEKKFQMVPFYDRILPFRWFQEKPALSTDPRGHCYDNFFIENILKS
jgi:hypothetical protein